MDRKDRGKSSKLAITGKEKQRLGEATMLPWRTSISVSVVSAVTDATCRTNGTVNRRLANLVDVKLPSSSSPRNGVKTSDVAVDTSRNLWFRLFVPTAAALQGSGSKMPVIVFFHGGGFTFLGPDSWAYDAVCRRFARSLSAMVVSVNYRLSPEHRHPCQCEDGMSVLRFLDEGSLPENADLSRCFLAGDSAGANLCHQVAVKIGGLEPKSMKRVRIAGMVSIQPFFGGEERTESEIRLARAPLVSTKRTDWMWKAYLPEGSDRDHPACNVCGPKSAEIRDLEYPQTVVIVGGLDPLQDWQRRYYQWLKISGKEACLVDYPNAIHAFYVFPELPEATLLLTRLQKFIK